VSALEFPVATRAADVAPRVKPSIYTEPFASRVAGRQKRVLGDLFGLKNFGVNLTRLAPGMCAGFRFGTGNAHHLVNETREDVVYLEIGDRTPGEEAVFPDDDLVMATVDGKHRWTHKDGKPY